MRGQDMLRLLQHGVVSFGTAPLKLAGTEDTALAAADRETNEGIALDPPMLAISAGLTVTSLRSDGRLLASPLDAIRLRHAQYIRSSGQPLLAVFNDILALTRIDAGRSGLDILPLALGDTVRGMISPPAVRAEALGLGLRLQPPPRLPPVLRDDARRLRRVLFNLDGNASKCTGGGSMRLVLAHQAQADGRTGLAIDVHNTGTGTGIAAEALPRLFSRFSQAGSASARRPGGTGPGLALERDH